LAQYLDYLSETGNTTSASSSVCLEMKHRQTPKCLDSDEATMPYMPRPAVIMQQVKHPPRPKLRALSLATPGLSLFLL